MTQLVHSIQVRSRREK